jgi:hypothetical protein
MGDTYHDPVDHLRTTLPMAGESLIDVVLWPGYLFVVAGVIGACASLAAFGTGHQHVGMTAGVTAVAASVVGLVWLVVEHRRIRRIVLRWYADHPDVPRQWPAS